LTLAAAFFSMLRKRRVETDSERRVLWVIIATIPGAIAGFALKDYAETTFRSPTLIATMLIVMGVVLWLVDRVAALDRSIDTMRCTDALLVGLAQMFAIIPGVSRSGSTITAGRALRLSRESAAVFSFLMSLPIIAAAVVFEGRHAIRGGINAPLVAGLVASAVSGWLAISVLLKYVARHSYGVFAVYRVVVGALVLAIAFMRG
jgi:undecaprenyl-diphosphatase